MCSVSLPLYFPRPLSFCLFLSVFPISPLSSPLPLALCFLLSFPVSRLCLSSFVFSSVSSTLLSYFVTERHRRAETHGKTQNGEDIERRDVGSWDGEILRRGRVDVHLLSPLLTMFSQFCVFPWVFASPMSLFSLALLLSDMKQRL